MTVSVQMAPSSIAVLHDRSNSAAVHDTDSSTHQSSITCPICSRDFTKVGHLRRHASTHLSNRPFECGQCSKAFARGDALQRHERTVHATKRAKSFGPSAEQHEQSQLGSGYSGTMQENRASSPQTSNPFLLSSLFSSPPSLAPLSPIHHTIDHIAYPPLPSAVVVSSRSPTPKHIFSNECTLDDLFSTWLSQEGGSGAAENALAHVFSDGHGLDGTPLPNQIPCSVNPPLQGNIHVSPHPAGSHQTEYCPPTYPVSSVTQLNTSSTAITGANGASSQPTNECPTSVSYPTLSSLDASGASNFFSGSDIHSRNFLPSESREDNRSSARQGLRADTWQIGEMDKRNLNLNDNASKRDPRPHTPSHHITTPEQVVAELRVEVKVSILWSRLRILLRHLTIITP